jgi:CubicO group peptidase (beta-lactamase class C family)
VQPPHCSAVDDRFAELKAAFEKVVQTAGIPGGQIGMLCGSILRSAAVGVVKKGGASVTTKTRFQFASMTKMLTASAAVGLADEGKLDLMAPLAQLLPTLGYGKEVSLHQLLTHTAGLPTLFSGQQGGGTLQELVLANANLPQWAPPGAVWNYNNPAYSVVGAALEVASGTAFGDLVKKTVLTPAGMATATMSVADLGSDFAYGHQGSAAAHKTIGPNDSYFHMPDYGPMGGAWGVSRRSREVRERRHGQWPAGSAIGQAAHGAHEDRRVRQVVRLRSVRG